MSVMHPEKLEQEEIIPYEDSSDNSNAISHYVIGEDNRHIYEPPMTIEDVIDIARITGQHLVAICGAVVVPRYDPTTCPMCKACVKINAKKRYL